jgi:hypothetical protein
MPNTPEVGFAFGAEGDQSLLNTIKALRAEMTSLKQQQGELEGSAQGAARGMQSLGNGAALTTRQTRDARNEMMLLGTEVGVRLPRALRTFLSEIPAIGTAMAAAFSVTAIVVMIQFLSEIPDKIKSIAASFMGWTSEAQKAYDAQIKLNESYLHAAEKAETEKRHENEAGLQGAALARQQLANNAGDVSQNQAKIKDLSAKVSALQARIDADEALKKRTEAVTGGAPRSTFLDPMSQLALEAASRGASLQRMSAEDLKRVQADHERLSAELQSAQEKHTDLEREGVRLRGQIGRESLVDAIAVGKERIETQAAQATDAAQNELKAEKSAQQVRQSQDEAAHEAGALGLKEYYARRYDEVVAGTRNEQKAIESQLAAANSELTSLQALPVGPTPQDRAARDREEESIAKRINDLSLQHYEAANKGQVELNKLITEGQKAEIDQAVKQLEIQEELARLQGKRGAADQLKAQIDDLNLTLEMIKAGFSAGEIQGQLQGRSAARTTATQGETAEKTFREGFERLQEEKAALQDQVASEQLLPYQAAQKLRQAYKDQAAELQKQIGILRQLAAANPNTDVGTAFATRANAAEKALIKLKAEIDKQDVSWEQWKTTAKQAIDSISTDMTSGINGWMQGQERFGKALEQTWNKIVMTAVNALEKVAAKFIADHLKMMLFHAASEQAQVAATATATAEKDVITRTSAEKSIMAKAKSAAAGAWDATVDIPIIGPILAPIAAAASFVGVMALAAFAKGGAVDARRHAPVFAYAGGGGPIRGAGTSTSDSIPARLSHGEYVINARAASKIGMPSLDAINRGAFLPPITQAAPYSSEGLHRYAASAQPMAAASGPSFSHTTQISGLQALDGASVRQALEEHGDTIGKIAVAAVKRYHRSNGSV